MGRNRSLASWLGGFVLPALLAATVAAGNVSISEILYNPAILPATPEDPHLEFIELQNTGPLPVDVSGWRFTRGIDFSLGPDTVILPDGFLVIAADPNALNARTPAGTTVLGPWTGRLSNRGETLTLVDANGVEVDEVPYADQGAWAQRVLGPSDYHHRGWQWQALPDGAGHSLERLQPGLSNKSGANWAASLEPGGTPGSANSMARADIAPLIDDPRVDPIIPGPNDPIAVSVEIRDEDRDHAQVRLYYRIDNSVYRDRDEYPSFDPNTYTVLPMSGQGKTYRAVIPPQPDRAVIEFFVAAVDSLGQRRTWPAPSLVDDRPEQVTNALIQVDGRFDPQAQRVPGAPPVYRLIFTAQELDRLLDIGDQEGGEANSNAAMNATFISSQGDDLQIRFNVAVRNRGHGSRDNPPNNLRINFAHDAPWQHVRAINLNSQYPYLQLLGSDLFRLASLPTAEATGVEVRLNGADLALEGPRMYGRYVHLQVIDGDFIDHHYPDAAGGSVYKGMRIQRPGADLRYLGDEPEPYRRNYFKQSQQSRDDWSDLIDLCAAFSGDPADPNYQDRLEQVADLDLWLRNLALHALLANVETCLGSGDGDDYYLVRPGDTGPFVLVPHDLDSILGWGSSRGRVEHGLFPAAEGVPGRTSGVPTIATLLNTPPLTRRYYRHIEDLATTLFDPNVLEPLMRRRLGDWVPPEVLAGLLDFTTQRRAFVLAAIGRELTATADTEPVDGIYPLDRPEITLAGRADVRSTAAVYVAGRPADWDARSGQWSQTLSLADGLLSPGINRVTVQARSAAQSVLAETFVDLRYRTNSPQPVIGPITADRVLTADEGPWQVLSPLVVQSPATLTVAAGATVFFAPDAGLTVTAGARLAVAGTAAQRVRLTGLSPGQAWAGLRFEATGEDNRLTYADILAADGAGQSLDVENARVLLEHVTFAGNTTTVFSAHHPQAVLTDCVFPSLGEAEPVHVAGLTGDDELLFARCRFGRASGYNDIMDLSGGETGGPVAQCYDCTFHGGSDDGIDCDGIDAHIEGCRFDGFRHDYNGDSTSNAVTTGLGGGHRSQLMLARNTFVDCDYAALIKEGCSITAQHNTFLGMREAAISFGEPDRSPPRSAGYGAWLDGNLFWDNAAPFQHYFEPPHPTYGPTELALDDCLIAADWHNLGTGDLDGDPALEGTLLASISTARQAARDALDLGAGVPAGPTLTGLPDVTASRQVILTVGGPGVTRYRYAVDDPGVPWSAGRPVADPLILTGLAPGLHTVWVQGQNIAGTWYTEPALGSWLVDPAYTGLPRLHELLVLPDPNGTTPPFVEIAYDGTAARSLAGYRLVALASGRQQVLSAQDVLDPATLTLIALDPGLGLDPNGDVLSLRDPSGDLVDQRDFGPQQAGLAVGRWGTAGLWRPCLPSPGQPNRLRGTGDLRQVRINEILADPEAGGGDGIELYNPGDYPVDLGGCLLSDRPVTDPDMHRLPALTLVPARGYLVLWADGRQGATDLPFKLDAHGEMLGLFTPTGQLIDQVLFGPQSPGVSLGRGPDGGLQWTAQAEPSLGAPNPYEAPPEPPLPETVELLPLDAVWTYRQNGSEPPAGWTDPAYDDRDWPRGAALLYVEKSDLPGPKNTPLTLGVMAYYFRTHLVLDTDPGRVLSLTADLIVDDGARILLNGRELLNVGLPAGPLSADTRAQRSVGNAQLETFTGLPVEALRAGDNVLTVEVHQSSSKSSDIVFGLRLRAQVEPAED